MALKNGRFFPIRGLLSLLISACQKRQRLGGEMDKTNQKEYLVQKIKWENGLSPTYHIYAAYFEYIHTCKMCFNYKGKYLQIDQEVLAIDIDVFQSNWKVFRDCKNFQLTTGEDSQTKMLECMFLFLVNWVCVFQVLSVLNCETPAW